MSESSVKFVKLVSGEEFVGVVSENDGGIDVKDPVVASQRMNTQNQIETALLPWCPFSKERVFEIDSSLVMIVNDVSENMLGAYNEKFGLIVMPSKPKLITG